MWLHYLKVAVRALAADRFFTFVNLLGLSVGLASVAFIFLHVTNEFSHDAWLPRHEALYRVDTLETHPGREPLEIALAPGPLRDALPKDFPQIDEVARTYLTPASVVRDGQPFAEDILVADPNFFSMLGLPFAAGSPEQALRNTTSVVLSARAAEKYFGGRNAIGQRLTIHVPQPRDFVVSAVFETLPQNSHMAFDIVIPFGGYFTANDEAITSIPDNWGGAYFFTYVRLKDGARVEDIERELPRFVDRNLPQWMTDLLKSAPHEFYQFRFIPIRDVHFDGAPVAAMKPPASRTAVLAISAVALLILVIASINFANLTTARSTLRAREVALRKVVGANRRQIFVQFLGEAVLLTTIAGVLGLSVVELTLPYLGSLLGLDTSFPLTNEWQLWAGLSFVVLVTALASGFYPSWIVSRTRPAVVFNRDHARYSGGAIRNVLVVGQFAISIALITVTIVMLMQMRFARDVDLGFDKENMLIVRVPEGPQRAALTRALAGALERTAGVIGVALSSSVPSDLSEDNLSIRLPGASKPVQVGYHKVDSRFFRTYGVQPLSGRTETMRRLADEPAVGDQQRMVSVVVNQAALKRLGFASASQAVGQIIRTAGSAYTIVGVVPDLHFRSLHETVRDEIYMLDDDPGAVISVRFRTDDLNAFLATVDRIWRDRVPDREIERQFLDDALDALYEHEQRQATLLSIFAGVAIVLSCLGLLAMAAFSVQRRTKEIAIRKVLGARTRDVARLLLWQFSKPVLLANVIAWPVAWLIVRDWLNQFAYRIDLPLFAFVVAGLAALLIAFLTVGAHAMKVARTSPALALRRE